MPALVHQDNLSTIALADKGNSSSQRTRHVNIRYFFLKDRIEAKEFVVKHCATENVIADIFTKPLQGQKFLDFRRVVLNLK